VRRRTIFPKFYIRDSAQTSVLQRVYVRYMRTISRWILRSEQFIENKFMRFSSVFHHSLAKLVLLVAAFVFLCLAAYVVTGQSRVSAKPQISLMPEAEKLLADLGYWIIKVDGKKDDSTYHAITAFQKVEGRRRTGVLTQKELSAMRLAARPAAKRAGAAHVEVDNARQVLFLVDENGNVTRILPVSTGTGKKYYSQGKQQTANTPRGDYKITRQIAGMRHAPLGDLYYPNYFLGGWAIHGSTSIPFLPASHGCVRIPNFAAENFSHLVSVGMDVFVY
jgi:hypothetical protein